MTNTHTWLGWAIGLVLLATVLGFVAWYLLTKTESLIPPVATAVVAGLTLLTGIIFFFVADSTYQEHKNTSRGRGDAARFPTENIDGRSADTITEMPDGFGNIASKCAADGYRAFVTTKANGASALYVIADPACKYDATGPNNGG